LAAFGHHVTCKVTGTKGSIWANWSAPDARHPQPVFGLRYSTNHESVEEVAFDQVTGEVVELEQQIAALVRSIRDGAPPIADAQDGRWAVLLCLAAQRSVDTGRPVEVAELEAG
jgi:myo-inositol 2-dehydrogenase/D-chiro-inositol 1-dehydrogenase